MIDTLDRVADVLQGQGVTLEELSVPGQEIRGEIVRGEYGPDAESGE